MNRLVILSSLFFSLSSFAGVKDFVLMGDSVIVQDELVSSFDMPRGYIGALVTKTMTKKKQSVTVYCRSAQFIEQKSYGLIMLQKTKKREAIVKVGIARCEQISNCLRSGQKILLQLKRDKLVGIYNAR